MGYDLHITRRKHWPDTGKDITADEWLAYVKRDSELRLRPEKGPHFAEWKGAAGSWLDWSDGQIYSKNPEPALIGKMASIARVFDAEVQGDDGEVYDQGSAAPREPTISFGNRIAGWLAWLRPRSSPKIERPPLPFKVGDKVRDTWRFEHTVLSIDPKAEHGMGVIRTRRSSDGTEHTYAMIAHPFKPVKNEESPY